MTKKMTKRDSHGRFAKGTCGHVRKHTEEAKRKMSEAKKGRVPWNKGLSKETDERVRRYADGLVGHGGYTDESRRKMRAAKLGVKRPPEVCKRIGEGHKGLPHFQDAEYRQKISERMKGEKNPMFGKTGPQSPLYGKVGPLASNWQGGKSFEPYPVGWNRTHKEQIRRRDHYTCQVCGVPEAECERRHHVHHIDYDKKNIKPKNLVTLCISCHMKTNFNRDYWEKHFNGEE